MSELFREKSLERVSSPEQLNDYIKVTTPSVWLVLIAVILLLVGILTRSVSDKVTVEDNDGNTHSVLPITFVTN